VFANPAIGKGRIRRTVQTWDWDRSVDGSGMVGNGSADKNLIPKNKQAGVRGIF